ncbi:MAG: hypothetical protein HYR63_16620 [Proteobacteria bacterium]|nr:hypothetical protein [Pseudomonadota bacterium]MBI3496591.1 hypothetical protein [Pseudomonadota bacterium]
MPRAKTVLVLHYYGLMPLAGVAMEAIHYVLGLRRLGYDAWYIEDNGANPYSPRENSVVWDATYNIGFIRQMMERFGMGDRWAYWDPTRPDSYHGLSKEALFRLYGEADALINLCGTTKLRDEHMACPVRILVDTDPIFEQIKLAKGDAASATYIDAHNVLYTIGENLGDPDCPVPLGTRTWLKTRPPVIPDIWPQDFAREPAQFSTIATWQHSIKDIEFAGERYQWSKHGNFLRFLDLPNRTKQRFRLAMITPNPGVNAEVAKSGWDVVDPVPVSSSFDAYAGFIGDSRGEFTVAKDIYVRGRSGWFSDRSVCYLASGRPVITQSTAFEKRTPTGRGLFAFQDWDDIFAALEAINSDYAGHCRAAREIAVEHFDSAKVLGRMMRQVGL